MTPNEETPLELNSNTEIEKDDSALEQTTIDETPEFLKGTHVVVKFYLNAQSERKNILTRTMGKIGLIKCEWYEQNPEAVKPRHKELWRVKIVQETFPGLNKGCFFMEPVERIMPIDIIKLVNGMYEEEEKNGILFIYPFRNDLPFILPLIYKRSVALKKCYATIVPLSSEQFAKT